MPIVNMMMKKGCSEERIERCMKEITNAIASNLEKTLPRMVRVTVMEIPEQYCLIGDERPASWHPTLTFDIGPGRSEESIQKTMHAIIDAVHDSLDVAKEDISLSIIMTPNEHFTIAGKVK